MDVEVLLAEDGVRGWHVALVDELAAAALSVRVATVPHGRTWDADVARLLRRERRLHHLAARGSAPAPPDRLLLRPRPARGPEEPRIRIDLTGGPPRPGWCRVTYDGSAGEGAAVRALLAHRFPVVRVVDADGRPLAEGRPGSELPGVVAAALDDVLAGCVQLVTAAVSGHRPRLPEETAGADADAGSARSPRRAWRGTLAAAPARRAYRGLYRSPHWRVGWRWVDGPGVLEGARLPADGWHRLPDDGRHFYADPFPVAVDGRHYLFVEDFDHRLGRGVISVTEVGEQGPRGVPRPVLETDVHLSYPAVVEDAGELWMIPETSGAHRVELYRATAFPDRWVLDSVLLDGVDANDVTPFRHGGRWWLSATVRRGGSCSDALHLWHAPSLRGPWRAHEHNPVLVDIRSARPAGRPEPYAGLLLRPAQDGSRRYGGALTVAEIVELTPQAFTQQVVGHVTPGRGWPGHRLHTVNRAGRLEVIDGSARTLRWASRSRP